MSTNNYVNYNIGGIVGSKDSRVYNNFQIEPSFFDNVGTGNAHVTPGVLNLLSTDIFLEYFEPLSEAVDYALQLGRWPLKIPITDLVCACGNGIYYNDGNLDSEVEWLINQLFSVISSIYNFDYKANIARVGPNYFFQMFPRD